MKRLFLTIFIFSMFGSVYAQQDLIEKVTQQAVKIDSLKRVIKSERDSNDIYHATLINVQDRIKKLEIDLVALEKIRVDKKEVDLQVQQKNDSITLLTSMIFEKEKQVLAERETIEQKIKEANQSGKSEVLSGILNSNKQKQFDQLLKSSTRESVYRDLQLVDDSTELKSILQDLEKYFNARELLEQKFDVIQIKNAQNQLNQIKQKSELLDKLKETVSNYQIFNSGLEEMISNIIALDNKEEVDGMSVEIKQMKLNKILSKISPYIFNYDFNLSDYPYLSDIILEIIKRKQPDPDAKLTDLLKKL